MEYFVGIAVIAAIVYLLTRKKEEAVVEAQPETKVEAVNAQPVVEVKQAVKAAPKAKAPAKKPAAKKPAAAKKAPAKKPAAKKPKA